MKIEYNFLDEPFKDTDGINRNNIDRWYKIFKSYVNASEKMYGEGNHDGCIAIGIDAIKIYEKLILELKNEGLLKGLDYTIAENKFREDFIKYPILGQLLAPVLEPVLNKLFPNIDFLNHRFSSKKYDALRDIKRLYGFIGSAYRAKAEECFQNKNYTEALKLSKNGLLYNPNDVLVHFTLAKTLSSVKAHKEAADSYETVMLMDKNYNEGRRILAELYKTPDVNDIDKCIKNYAQYLLNAKDDKYAWLNYAGQCYKLGLHRECKNACEEIFKCDPTLYNAIIVYMLNLLKVDGYSQKAIKSITQKVVENYIRAANIKKCSFDFKNRDKNPDRKLKIGFLSSDFYNHVVSKFFLPIVENHDGENYEIFLYSLARNLDGVSERYKKTVEHFVDCSNMSVEEIDKKVYEDEIDIFIDLNVHTGDAKTIALAAKPAPVQAVYLGYPNTSGLNTVDYILTCRDTILPEEAKYYTEKPAYIEAGYEVFDKDFSTLPNITPAPYIKNKYVTLGVFNATAKVTEEMIKVWAYILKNAKNTKIMFQYITYYTENIKANIYSEFEKYGIKKDRIIFDEKDPSSHYNNIAHADIALDTFPYSGTGTTMDCIMMGLPIVCVEGYHATSRPTSRILKAMGEHKLIAKDFDDYVKKALKLINNPEVISAYRKVLRTKMMESKLTDGKGFTKSFEKTLRNMWQEYCSR